MKDRCVSSNTKMDGSYHVEYEGWNESMVREIDSENRRSNRLRRMPKGLNEGIGCMPMKIGFVPMDGHVVSMSISIIDAMETKEGIHASVPDRREK